jgi:hypothetical protein
MSSKGEFDAPPRYNHESNAFLNNKESKKGMANEDYQVKRSYGDK